MAKTTATAETATTNIEAKTGGNPKRELLYAQAAKHAQRAIDVLVEIMNNGDNDNAKMAAAKTILAKAIPDLKAMEITGKDGGPIQINILGDYISKGGWHVPTPAGSAA